MREHLTRVAVVFACLLPPAGALHAQVSTYVSLDDPRLPQLEHLFATGAVRDPSPMVRPILRSEVLRVLREAEDERSDTEDATGRLIRSLVDYFDEPPGEDAATFEILANGGLQSYTHARRDLQRAAGIGNTQPYADVELRVRLGASAAAVSRIAVEQRLREDPDFPRQNEVTDYSPVTSRFPEAYVTAQFKWLRLFYGQIDRSWGPQGTYGIATSNFRYPTADLSFEINTRKFRFLATWSELRDTLDADGEPIRRFFLVHRASVQLGRALQVGVWESSVMAGREAYPQSFFANPFTIVRFATANGLGDRGNQMLGLDVHWRIRPGLLLDVDVAIDELDTNRGEGEPPTPNRLAGTVSLSGGLGGQVGWRALYTTATSIAFRTFDPQENFTDLGRGLGRNFADYDQLTLTATRPVTPNWLGSLEATLIRQGEGRINDPLPPRDELATYPERFLGTVEKTYRLAAGVTGRQGPLAVTASAGYHRRENADNQPGVTANDFVGRIQATAGFRIRGLLD